MADLKELTKTAELASISERLNIRYGNYSCTLGTEVPDDPPRIPTGIFTFDFATGGGFPLYQIAQVKGAEHGGKTSLLMSAMSKVPKICWRCFKPLTDCECSLPPIKMKSVWCDVEGTFNRFWATCLGCDPSDYYLNISDAGSEYGDIVDYTLRADDCGLVVVDSIAALLPADEMDSTLDTRFIGNQSKLISGFLKKVVSRLNKEHKRDHPCVVILTNQLRANIGVMYGPTTMMAGGWAPKYLNGLTINIAKKAMESDAAKKKFYNKEKDLTLGQKHGFYIEKFKSLKLAESGSFIRVVANAPELGYKRGEVVDYKAAIKFLMQTGLMTKSGTGYSFRDSKGTQKDFIAAWQANPDMYFSVQRQLIDHVKLNVMNFMEEVNLECHDESVDSVEEQ